MIIEIEEQKRAPKKGEMYLNVEGKIEVADFTHSAYKPIIVRAIFTSRDMLEKMEEEIQRRVELELAKRELEATLAETGESGYEIGTYGWAG